MIHLTVWSLLLLAAPEWLTPYPGAQNETHASTSARTESRFTAAAKLEQVATHYATLLDGVHLAYTSNPDGIGVSMRASAPECDLLITLREIDGGTSVRVTCASRANLPSAGPVVTSQPLPRPAGTEARRKQINHDMSVYDQPVYPQKKKKDAPAAP